MEPGCLAKGRIDPLDQIEAGVCDLDLVFPPIRPIVRASKVPALHQFINRLAGDRKRNAELFGDVRWGGIANDGDRSEDADLQHGDIAFLGLLGGGGKDVRHPDCCAGHDTTQ